MNWFDNYQTDNTLITPSTIGIYTVFNNEKKYQNALINSAKIFDIVYPNKSDLLCHWCRHTFETEPVYLPFKRDFNKHVHTKGYFCSFNCAKAFAVDNSIDSSLLFEMYRVKYNLKARYNLVLKKASPWQALKANGGIQTIEEFRKDFDILEKTIEYTEYPIVHSICQLKENNTIKKVKTSNQEFSIDNLVEEVPNNRPKKGRKPKVVVAQKKNTLGILSAYLN